LLSPGIFIFLLSFLKFLIMKKIKSPVWVILCLAATITVIVSCNESSNDGGVFIPVPVDTSAFGKIDHFIPRDSIAKYQAAFRRDRDSLQKYTPGFTIPFSEAFNKPGIIEILKLKGCVGVKIMYGIKQAGDSSSMRLILVGVDSLGNNLYVDEHSPIGKSVEKSTKNDAEAAKYGGSKDTTGGIEQGQCDPPCINY
jgi:hypothetical protein